MDFLLLIGGLFLLIALNVPIALALAGAGMFGLILADSPQVMLTSAYGMWATTNSFSLAAVPLFILMARILENTRAFDLAIRSLDPWASLLPGRLLHTNILGSTFFAAITGSSSSSCVAIAMLTYRKLVDRGYNRNLILATLAGPTTLGILIPPSIVLILYGVIAEESISRLFMAGLLPGLLMSILFVGYVILASLTFARPVCRVMEKYSWGERIRALPGLLPVSSLIIFILGGIYLGWIIPTEAAAWGVVGALLIALLGGDFSIAKLLEAFRATISTSVMILFIVTGASLLSMAFAQSGMGQDIVQYTAAMELSKIEFLIILAGMYVLLGCILEGLSMVVLTIPLLLPIVNAYGFNPIWFGIYVVILIEIAQFTPPVGLNLFILRGVTNESIVKVAKAAAPMIALMLLSLVLITLFPQVATWLPSTMK